MYRWPRRDQPAAAVEGLFDFPMGRSAQGIRSWLMAALRLRSPAARSAQGPVASGWWLVADR